MSAQRRIWAVRPKVEYLEDRVLLSVLWNEGTNGDLSNNQAAPTPLTLALGTNSIIGTVGTPDNQDWVTLHVPTGMSLSSLVLASYASTDSQGFLGVQQGTSFSGSTLNPASYLGYVHYGTGATNGTLPPTNLVGSDLLPLMGDTSLASGSQGFTPPLGSGDYTFLIQQLGATTNYQFDFVTTSTGTADLTIAKSHTAAFRQGDASDLYTIIVTNSGTAATSGAVTVTDTLPAGLSPTSADNATINGWTVTFSGQTITATRSNALAAGASYLPLPLTVAVAIDAPASVTNTAVVAGGGEQNTGNDSADDPTTITQVPDLVIAKSHNGDFTQGDPDDAYSITVANSGVGPTGGAVTVTDTLPAGLTPVGDTGTINGWTVSTSGQTVTASRSDALAAGASYQPLTLTVAVDFAAPAGTVTNTATVAGGGEINTANDSASDPTTIVAFSGPNQAPVNTLPASYSGNQESALALTGIAVADADAGSASEQVTFSVTTGTLAVSTSVAGGVTAGAVAGNGTNSLTITAPLAALNATLADPAGLVYTAPEDGGATLTLTMVTNDLGHTGSGGAQTSTNTSTLNLAPIPEPPVNTMPPSAATSSDTSLALTGISIADEDAGNRPIAVVLSAGSGTLAVSTSVNGGIGPGDVTGNGSGAVLILSTLAKIDATFAAVGGIVFTPAGGFAGTTEVTLTTNDLGNNDIASPLTDTTSEAITVTRVVDHYSVTVPSGAVAGVSFSVTLTARDHAGNPVSNYAGTAIIVTGDPHAQVPAQATFSGGVAQLSVTLDTTGSETVSAFDVAAPAVAGTATVAVSAAAPAALTFLQPPATTVVGAPFLTPVSVAVVDAFGNIVAADNRDVVSVRLQSNPTKAVLGGTTRASVVQGVAVFPGLQLSTAGTGFTLLATGPVLPIALSAPFNTVAVAGLTVTTTQTTSVTAGSTQVSITVQAVDSKGAVVAGYPGVVHFTSSDVQAVLPPDSPLPLGQATFTVTLKTAGMRSISVSDLTKPTLTGTLKKPLTVIPAGVAGFNVTGLAMPSTAGQKQMITVTAVDAFGNVAPSFTGTVTLSSTDTAAVFPPSVVFATANAGKQTAAVTLKTPGLRTVTVSNGSLTGSDANVPVGGTTPTVLLEPDPSVPTQSALVVIGTPGNDTINVLPTNAAGTQLEVDVNGVSQGNFFTPTGHVLVFGLAGNDTIRLLSGTGALSNVKVAIPSVLDGGAGNDILDATGSSQTAILVGGAGNDSLTGSGANSILIGGLGIDVLHGGAGETIFSPNPTAFDTNTVALLQLMQEWQNTGSAFLTRVQHLSGSLAGGANLPFLLNVATVQKDLELKQLFAGTGHNWYLFTATAPGQVMDPLTGDILTAF
jgi:uncharacterized repeat protein (TIGR01451 family)